MFYIKQLKTDDCGFSALKTLLANLFKKQEYLYIPQDESLGAYSYKQLIKEAEEYGVTLEGIKVEGDLINEISDKPFLASLNIDDNKHLIYVHKINKASLEIFDPMLGRLTMTKKEFLSKWDQTCLIVKEINEKEIPIMEKDMSVLEKIIISIFETITVGLVLASLFFMNDESKLFISIILLGGSLLVEIGLRVYLMNFLKKIDKKYVYSLELLPNDPYEYLKRLEDYKKTLVTTPVNILISIILFFFLSVILILNSPYSAFIVLAVLLILLLDVIFINPSYSRSDQEVSSLERRLGHSLTMDSFKEQFSLIRERVNKYTFNRLIIEILRYMIIIISLFISMKLSQSYSILFAFINFAFALLILKQGSNILDYPIKKEDLKVKKARLINTKNDVKTS